MEKNILTGINFDYILVLKQNDTNHLELVRVPIERHLQLIDDLYDYVDDDYYDTKDMYNKLRHSICFQNPLPFCLAHEYGRSYIDDIKFPEDSMKAFQKSINERHQCLYDREYRKLKKQHKDWSETILHKEAEENIKADIVASIHEKKEKYIDECLNYIYAFDYSRTLISVEKSDKLLSFSNENHGRFAYEHEVNEDLKIRISTNFCYGSATYFHVIITYKGIDILPYSVWVKYYYAGFAELLHYTRSYESRRNYWENCLSFVAEFVNKAIDSPEKFIQEEVVREVDDMMKGLRVIYSQGKDYLNKIMEVAPAENRKYVGIRCVHHPSVIEHSYYSVYPKEMYLVYRLGKIAGALQFLDSLKQLSSLCEEVNTHIEEIFTMNRSIYPEIIDAIPPIEEDIKQLEIKMKPDQKRLAYLEYRYNMLDSKLQKLLQRCKCEERTNVKDNFCKRFPDYDSLLEEQSQVRKAIWEVESDINRRRGFLKDLNTFKKLIEENNVLASAA